MSQDKEVHVVCLESRREMPADKIEVEEGREEGLFLHNQRGPTEAVVENGKLKALRTVRCVSVFDENGRFSPQFDNDDIEDIAADTIFFAIGQTSDLSFLSPADGVESVRGLIKVKPATYQTTAPDVFACGDIAHGPRLFIDVIASAQIAARSMHDYLRETRTDVVVKKRWVPAGYSRLSDWTERARVNPPVLDSQRRAASVDIVEERFPADLARQQASRCLRCNVDTVFDTSICIACNGCVDVCPEGILKLVSMRDVAQDPAWMGVAATELGMSLDDFRAIPSEQLDEFGAVMLKDETTCIRCAMCASQRPTRAVTMQRFEFERECVSIPDRNPKILYRDEPV